MIAGNTETLMPLRETKDRSVYRRAATCETKASYPTITSACEGKPSKQFVYLCPVCRVYHRTTQPLRAEMQAVIEQGLAREQQAIADREATRLAKFEPHPEGELGAQRWHSPYPPSGILLQESGPPIVLPG